MFKDLEAFHPGHIIADEKDARREQPRVYKGSSLDSRRQSVKMMEE